MAKVFLGLGTNLGDKRNNLLTAVTNIEEKIGKVTSLSSFYETEPWGFESENSFLNAALCVETSLDPATILHIIKEIEIEMGRTQKSVNKIYSDRPIDIDILLYDDLTMETDELTIPHPLMTERDFVMKPLMEIADETVRSTITSNLREYKKRER
ncbi:MAG: 2-amino-4-hydroxy-6-hydroxymethyldihydropteridine diphosphokinase [Candidatus Phocaeicola faecigallinarum]|uniref:2-amino-4-hydroxy-6-hydroxymethyldihydropteridine pyrophosphokinase n=1 Tax=Candidatus Phocaeicola faecigallinarum TaxID=2838732 RepID=A0A948TAN4_9BACT|nr:2-amino-4-hydroxy-6-hydroxymethyldihydropteridine diphosphokinase [Candidatus Phocaeicola faecigallinarum]